MVLAYVQPCALTFASAPRDTRRGLQDRPQGLLPVLNAAVRRGHLRVRGGEALFDLTRLLAAVRAPGCGVSREAGRLTRTVRANGPAGWRSARAPAPSSHARGWSQRGLPGSRSRS